MVLLLERQILDILSPKLYLREANVFQPHCIIWPQIPFFNLTETCLGKQEGKTRKPNGISGYPQKYTIPGIIKDSACNFGTAIFPSKSR